jgi:hypothetical protein
MINNYDIKLLSDPKFYLENFCKVKTAIGGLAPFILYDAQKDLYNTLKKHDRVIILKARQLGFSTGVTGYFYHQTITNEGRLTALIGYNSALTSELLDKVKTLWKTTPKELRPKLHLDNKYEISFPDMDSKIIVLSSNDNVGSGYTLHFCLVTELSKWEKAEEKMTSLLPATKEGKLVIESSPHGVGNLYHRMWVQDNEFVKKEYGWWWKYTREEMDKMKRELGNDQLFAQEYELSFLMSGRCVFDKETLALIKLNILDVADKNQGQEVHMDDDWMVYKLPEQDKLYVLGCDISQGVEGGDYSVATIIDRITGEEVASYRKLVAPDILGYVLDKWGRKYNNALMVVEANNQGLTTLSMLKHLMYPAMYYRQSGFDKLSMNLTDRLGWRTTQSNKYLLIGDLQKAVRDKLLIFHNRHLMNEMMAFQVNSAGEMEPESGFHDDAIMASAIAYQGFKVLYGGETKQLDYNKHLKHVSYF